MLAMLLVLAPPEDEVATRFERMVRSRGVGVARAAIGTVSMQVELTRSGTASVELRALGARVHGVLNRGLSIDSESQFEDSERLAAWWSALAYFPGPVVNRPSRLGFLPELDVLSLVERVPNLDLAPMHIGSKTPPSLTGSITNIHSARDGRFLGRGNLHGEEELCLFTGFDPERTCRILWAGDKSFATDIKPSASIGAAGVIKALGKELRSLSATFSLVVLQVSSSSIELVHATPVPNLSNFMELEEDVYEALLNHLLQ